MGVLYIQRRPSGVLNDRVEKQERETMPEISNIGAPTGTEAGSSL